MWRCAKCTEQNEDQFLTCWKCQQRKPGDAVATPNAAEDSHLDLIVDPEKPVPMGEGGHVQCPTCGLSFKVAGDNKATRLSKRLESALCPHCSNPVNPELLVRVSARPRDGASNVSEVIYACPYCGKVLGIIEGSDSKK